MTISRLNWFLFLAFVASVIGNWSIGRDYTQPNLEFMPEMVHSIPYNTYTPNPNFTDGMTLRTPVPHTIARGQMPLHYNATPEGATLAGNELQNPFLFMPHRGDIGSIFVSFPFNTLCSLSMHKLPEAKQLVSQEQTVYLKRGAFVWSNYCQVCHGASGRGDGPVTSRGVPPPPSLLIDKAMKMKDGQMFHILTYGQGNMASYSSQLSHEDRWLAILHIRSLQKQAAPKGDTQ